MTVRNKTKPKLINETKKRATALNGICVIDIDQIELTD